MATDVVLDTSATNATLAMGGMDFGTIDAVPMPGSSNTLVDHDWYALNLTAGDTYQFTGFASSGNLNDLALALRDASGNIVDSQGVIDNGTGGPVFMYVARTTGTYYLDVSAGGINPGSLTGGYEISASDVGGDRILDTPATTATLSMNGLLVDGSIDPVPVSGSFNTSYDVDWYAVSLTAGHTYSFSVDSFGSTTLTDVAIDLRDTDRDIIDPRGIVDNGTAYARFLYTATSTGTFYVEVTPGGSNPANLTGSYDVNASDLGVQPADTVLDTSATTASLTMNGNVTGSLTYAPASGSFNKVTDHDWYAVNLTAGERYTFSATGIGADDVAIALMNANRTVVDSQGVVDSGFGLSAIINFVAPTTGTYYLDLRGGGSDPGDEIGEYQIRTTDNGPDHLVINLVADASVTQEFGANYQTSTFWTAVESAANFFESTFFDPITVTIDVGWGEINGSSVPSNESESLRNQTEYTFSQIVTALENDATSASDTTAIAHLPTQDPGPGGTDFRIADAEAMALGLPISPPAVDGFIGFSTDWSPSDANFVGAVEHEISEVLGRAAGINASTGAFTGEYSVLDLFRYAAGPPVTAEPSSSVGPGGQGSTYFSIDGGQTALDTFSSTAGRDPGGDWAAGTDDAFAAVLPGGAAPVTAADIAEMDVLGYNTTPAPLTVPTGGIDYRVPLVNGTTSLTPTSYISPASIAAAGYQFAIDDIGTADNLGYLRASDALALEQQGLSIVSVFEKAGMSDTGANGLYSNAWVNYFNNNGALGQGTADAIAAIQAAQAAGQMSGAIYFAVDLDPTAAGSGISSTAALPEIDEYFREINTYFTQVSAPYSIGVFGAGDTLSYLQADPSSGVKYTWLADTWSGQISAVSSKNLEQADTSGGAVVGGQSVDLDSAYTSNFGQWNSTAIEAHGATSLVAVGQNYFLDPVGGSSGPELKIGGAAIVAGQFGAGVVPIAAERTANGYEVAWEATATGKFAVWSTDTNGNYVSTMLGGASGSSIALENLEPSFQQDLNGDGTVGVPAPGGSTNRVIEAYGSTWLMQAGSNYGLFDSAGNGPLLAFGGAPVVVGQFGAGVVPIGAERTTTGYEVAWEAPSGRYGVWSTDSGGNYVSTIVGGAAGSSFALEALEPSFQQDLNGDGTLGPPGMTVIETDGSSWLTQVGSGYYLYGSSGTGPELKIGGAPVAAGQFGAGVVPIGAEQTASGYEVAWAATATGTYGVWATDTNGNYVSTILGNAPASSTALENLEPSFQQDLNGDGVIGALSGIVRIVPGPLHGGTDTIVNSGPVQTSSGIVISISAGSNASAAPPASPVLATGDFLGDGGTDLLWLGSNDTPEISETSGGSVVSTISLPAAPASSTLVGGGDLDGSGKSDILWQSSGGAVTVWDANINGTISATSPGNPGAAWQLTGTADVNGDGKSDLLFVNAAANEEQVWLMNGTQAASVQMVSGTPYAPQSGGLVIVPGGGHLVDASVDTAVDPRLTRGGLVATT